VSVKRKWGKKENEKERGTHTVVAVIAIEVIVFGLFVSKWSIYSSPELMPF